MAVKDLIEKIDSLGIMSEVSVRDWCQSLPIVEQPTDEKSLILAMINANLISKYQGKRLRNNVGDSLIVGNYLIKDIIGRGGMGDVYLAEHRHMKHQVAIKMLSRRLTKKEGTIAHPISGMSQIMKPNQGSQINWLQYFWLHYLGLHCT